MPLQRNSRNSRRLFILLYNAQNTNFSQEGTHHSVSVEVQNKNLKHSHSGSFMNQVTEQGKDPTCTMAGLII